ncbi:MAG: factor-independent urate hydroxylase [Spirochaetia bacterium]
MPRLRENSYGKCDVRLTKVVRAGATHTLWELTAAITLTGDFARIYTDGDNSPCIPTDTMKNTVYALAKKNDFRSPEEFAQILTRHFIQGFEHVQSAEVSIDQKIWTRIPVGGSPHDHSFSSAGSGRRTCAVKETRRGPPRVSGGLAGLEVIKTTGSGFSGFLKDEYTTLQDTTDRIFATSIDATWDFLPAVSPDYNEVFAAAKRVIQETFATHESLSVQQTIYAMGEALLREVPDVAAVSFTLPNQHRIPVDLSPFNLTNGNEIFVATSEPFGLIKGTVARE